MKLHFFIGLSILFCTNLCLFSQENTPQFKSINPEKTVFAFDLHGVVFQPDYIGILKKGLSLLNKELTIYFLFNPVFFYDAYQIRKKTDVLEDFFAKLSEKYPRLQKYIPSLIELINEQKPIKQTVQAIKDLKKQGYKLYVFSNIGIGAFRELQKKYPDIFKNFNGYVVAQPQDGWLQKPNKEAYSKFLKKFNIEPENIIFVDDKLINLKPAQDIGMHTIHFTDPHIFKQKIYALIETATA